MTTVYKLVVMAVDHEELGAEEIVDRIPARVRGVGFSVVRHESRDVEWHDDHPLNSGDRSKARAAFDELFANAAVRVEAEERDRLRREVEALRDDLEHGRPMRFVSLELAALEAQLATRLDAILKGES